MAKSLEELEAELVVALDKYRAKYRAKYRDEAGAEDWAWDEAGDEAEDEAWAKDWAKFDAALAEVGRIEDEIEALKEKEND